MNIIIALMMMSASYLANAQESALEFEDVKVIDISNSSGNITVTGDDNLSKTTVKIKKNRTKEDCNLATEMAGNNLNIEQKAPAGSRKQCETDIQVRVPQKNIDLKLVVINSNGDVSVNSYAGDLDVEMDNGNLKVSETIINDGKISLGRGSAKFDGIQASEVFMKLDDGNAAIGFSKILDRGKFEVRAKSGNVDITIPMSAKVDTSYIVGEARVSGLAGEKQSGSTGRYLIELIVPNGNFSVNKR